MAPRSPTVQPGLSGLAQALLGGVKGYQGQVDRDRVEEERQLGRSIKMSTEADRQRASDTDFVMKGGMPTLGQAIQANPLPAAEFVPNAPNDFDRTTKQFRQSAISPTDEVAVRGGMVDRSFGLRQKMAETEGVGRVSMGLRADERGLLQQELGPAVEKAGGLPEAARLPSSAADWLGRPPERSLRIGDPGYADAMAEVAKARASATGGGVMRPPTEVESKDFIFAGLMRNAMPVIQQVAPQVRPEVITALRVDPSGLAKIVLTGPERRFVRAIREFTAAALRKESGAAIQPFEISDMMDRYIDTGFDDAETRQDKSAARENYMALLEATSARARNYYNSVGGTQPAPAKPTVRKEDFMPEPD